MGTRFGLKLLLIGALILVLMVPMLLLRGLVLERQQRGRQATEEIAASSARAQTIVGPLLLLEGERTVRRAKRIGDPGRPVQTVIEDVREPVRQLLPPAQLSIDNTLRTERRVRGLFAATLFHDALKARGSFIVPAAPMLDAELIAFRYTGAKLVLGLGDARGIRDIAITANGQKVSAQPGSAVPWLPEGLHAPLPLPGAGALPFAVDLQLLGTQSIAFVPIGDRFDARMRADWPHPSFSGNYLPESRSIKSTGFDARWRISRLASQAQQRLSECGAHARECSALFATAFKAELIDPVDRYLKTERAMKYALLFLVLVFGAVFFVEALKAVRVHAVQYALTGLALAMFFLLLLSLSEHIGFGRAYLVAATACVALVAVYMAGVLGSMRRGVFFAALLAGLYGLLYGVLQSEDYALLMGTLALFALLATVMLITRRFDWYAATADRPLASNAPVPPVAPR